MEGVFFSGWRGHDELPLGLACADLFIGPSVDEPFGQVFLEAMSCGVPVIATRSGGPPSFVNTLSGRPNGWLGPPADVDALARTPPAAPRPPPPPPLRRGVRRTPAPAEALGGAGPIGRRSDVAWRRGRRSVRAQAAAARRRAQGQD